MTRSNAPHTPARYILQVVLLAALYYSAGQFSFSLAVSHNIVTLVVFIAEGISLAATILFGATLWPGVFLGQLLLAWHNGLAWPVALVVSAINSAEAVLGAYLFHRWRLQHNLGRVRDVAGLLILITVVLQPFSATLGNLALWVGAVVPGRDLGYSWLSWWLGNSLGQILFVPFLLSLWQIRRGSLDLRRALATTLLIAAATWTVFRGPQIGGVSMAFALTTPVLVWIAFFWGMPSVSLGVAIITLMALSHTQWLIGPFAVGGEAQLVELNIFLLGTALTSLFVTALFDERKQSEITQARLAAIVENSNDAIISRDLDGTILTWNSGATKMLGYTAAEAIGTSALQMFQGAQQSRWTVDREHLRRGTTVSQESSIPARDGRMVPIQLSDSPIRDHAGTIVGTSTILHDITARKQAQNRQTELEAQLRESQKMQAIGTLAGGIAHDFNNVLGTILGNSELAYEDVTTDPAAVRESLNEIRKAGSRGRDLVQQILSFSRRQPTARRRIDPVPVAREAGRLLRSTVPSRLSLEVQCALDVPHILADATQIQQVLINLTTNAMQAMPEGPGSITIGVDTVTLDGTDAMAHPELLAMQAHRSGRTVRLTVSDTGPGIAAGIRERIFEPFFTTKAVNEGTGLGLSVALGIVQTHEGAITVASEPGHGATFTILLPAAAPADTAPEPTAITPAGVADASMVSGRHILFLDDNDSLVSLFERLLARRGGRVSAFSKAPAALAAVGADPAAFDLVVTDYNMPGMSGLDVARAVRVLRADLPVAVMSGFVDTALSTQAIEAGVRAVIHKADDVAVVCAEIERLLDKTG